MSRLSVKSFCEPSISETNIASLPDEILLHIFSMITQIDLYRNVRLVCTRWNRLSHCSILWKKINDKEDIPFRVLCKWIRDSPLLKELHLEDRRITQMVYILRCRKSFENMGFNKKIQKISNILYT
ncbi:uncharacterized protein LOC114328613 [Diabrotica virgifera virgifera]|uniref:F-box domain-containing protein n=1 Tax=Diabrotica virgifera virgifera TaxID=50390 RepID=A0ABM5II29_DIAVI|nr:uncharacterized protein LOC114328613 [Diabrotica virgifera virgifera]